MFLFQELSWMLGFEANHSAPVISMNQDGYLCKLLQCVSGIWRWCFLSVGKIKKKKKKESMFVSQTIKSLLASGRSFYLQGIKQLCPDPRPVQISLMPLAHCYFSCRFSWVGFRLCLSISILHVSSSKLSRTTISPGSWRSCTGCHPCLQCLQSWWSKVVSLLSSSQVRRFLWRISGEMGAQKVKKKVVKLNSGDPRCK